MSRNFRTFIELTKPLIIRITNLTFCDIKIKMMSGHAWIQRGEGWDRGLDTPQKNHKNKGILSHTGPDPLK